MRHMTFWAQLATAIAAATGTPFQVREQRVLGGGCINAAYVIADGARRFFVKTHAADRLAMFEVEAAALREIGASGTLRVPTPVCHGVVGPQAYLVLEYLDLGPANARAAERLGEGLAAMHRTRAPSFGWHQDNAIGSTPQPNAWSEDWVAFYGRQRLGFQLKLAARGGCNLLELGERLIERLPAFFSGYAPVPSLLHGDLWGGNWGALGGDVPVIFDPATYYGDREADLAMTELFGGFPARFYAAYDAAWPRDPGYAVRKDLYNLYHVLNHFNLFGGGYGAQARRMMERLLAAVK